MVGEQALSHRADRVLNPKSAISLLYDLRQSLNLSRSISLSVNSFYFRRLVNALNENNVSGTVHGPW